MLPKNTVTLDESSGKTMLKLMDVLDDHDDVQNVYTNADLPEELMADE